MRLEKNLCRISDNKKDIEFFLAEDIIQGEKIPFYLLWNETDPQEIILEPEGFKSIIELYNAIESKIITEGNKKVISGFHVPGYIGGLLSTEITDKPITHGSLTVTISEKNGEIKSFKEVRKLYTTQLKLVDSPEEIFLDDSGVSSKISIELKGKTTVFLDIEEMEKNECYIDIPPDVKAIFVKFHESLVKGLNDLKEKFPEHLETINLILGIPNSKMSVAQYIEKYGEKIKESFQDEIFCDAISTIIITALFEQVGVEDRLFKPLNEFFEYSAVDRAYFLNPLLHVRIPPKGCLMAVGIKGRDLLNQDCGSLLEIKVPLKANKETFKPLKDLFSIRRIVVSKIQDANQLLEIVKSVSEMIRGEKRNSLRIECMNGLGVYGTHIKVDSKFSKWVNGLTHGSMEVPASEVYEVKTIGFSPYPQTLKGNVIRSNGKLIIDLKPALKFDLFSIEIAYRMDEEFLKGLVRARSSPEPLSDSVRYELSAQLRNPEGLALGFSEVEIEEFPVSARVHIAERVNMNVPDYVKELLRIETDLLNEPNPHEGLKIIGLQRKKTQLMKKLGKASLTDKIQDLSLLLTPSHFLNYVKTVEDFKLHQCERGTDFFKALGMLQLPKSMNVISRTDLNLKKPAAKGTMIYESRKFDEEIADMFK